MKLIGRMRNDGTQRPAVKCQCGQLVLLPYQPQDDGINLVVCTGCGQQFEVEVRIQKEQL